MRVKQCSVRRNVYQDTTKSRGDALDAMAHLHVSASREDLFESIDEQSRLKARPTDFQNDSASEFGAIARDYEQPTNGAFWYEVCHLSRDRAFDLPTAVTNRRY